MSHTILEFKNSYVRFNEYDLIVASLLILDINKKVVETYFPTMKNTWLYNFKTSGNGCSDLKLDMFITCLDLKKEFLEMIDNTCQHVHSNTYDDGFYLSPIYSLITAVGIGVGRKFPSNLILIALYGLRKLLTLEK